MKAYQLVFPLTIANAALLIFSLARPYPTAAQGSAQVLRVRALELIDDHGRVRAEIRIFPPDPKVKMPDGTRGYPETVLFRLMNSEGRPNVKISATEDGSGVSLGGESNPTNIQLLARGDSTLVKLIDKNGAQHVIKP